MHPHRPAICGAVVARPRSRLAWAGLALRGGATVGDLAYQPRLAGAQLAADSEVIEISVDGSGSSSSSVNGSLSSGGSGEASRRDTRGGSSSSSSSSSSSRGTSVVGLAALGMVNPDNYLPNSRQNSRGRQNGGRLRSSQMWGDCDTDTVEEDAPSRG